MSLIKTWIGTAAAAAALSLASQAQTTHVVMVSGTDFTPSFLKIDVGDTVDWVWGVGSHNVVSGSSGSSNGIFTSGAPTLPANTFSMTFDQPFLDANPMPGNLYDYFCEVHFFFGMTGQLQIAGTATSTVRNGNGVNPLGFVETSPPILGGTWTTTVDIATPGHLASIVAISTGGPAPGIALGGLFSGELLILPPLLPPDTGIGSHSIPIPNDCSLIGVTLNTQGATFTPGTIAFNNAIDIQPGV